MDPTNEGLTPAPGPPTRTLDADRTGWKEALASVEYGSLWARMSLAALIVPAETEEPLRELPIPEQSRSDERLHFGIGDGRRAVHRGEPVHEYDRLE